MTSVAQVLKSKPEQVVFTIAASDSVYNAIRLMAEKQIGALVVTEGGSKTDLALAAGETVEFCANGCFVTLPNGDLEALTGSETVEISGGVARIK